MSLKKITKKIINLDKSLDEKTSTKVLKGFFSALKGEFKEGEERFVIPNFGTFYVVITKERFNKDLNSDKMIRVPSQKLLRFKASPAVKELIN